MEVKLLTEAIQELDEHRSTGLAARELAEKIVAKLNSNPRRLVFSGKPFKTVVDDIMCLEVDTYNGNEETFPYVQIKSWDVEGRFVSLKALEDESLLITVEVV